MKNLREIRKKKRITQVRMGIELGVSQETISSYERGKSFPSVESLCRLAEYLHVSTDYLLGRTDIPTPVCRLSADGLSAKDLEIADLIKRASSRDKDKIIGYVSALVGER